MGETKWTVEQKEAIETRRCNLLIAAAAGSGKTAVLVERIIKIITNEEDPVDIDKLLVVTFTSAAASEMRERIAKAITKALDENPGSKNLQKQLTLLGRSNITTMHSFCLEVIKNNYHVIDLDPSFRILDETEGVLLKAEVIEDLFEDKYEGNNKDFCNLIEAYSSSRDDEKIKEIILELYRFSMSGPWPEKWLNEKSEAFNINTIAELDKSKWVEVLKENIEIELTGLISMEKKALELCTQTSGLEPYIQNFDDDILLLSGTLESVNGSIMDIYNTLNNISFSKLKSVRKTNVSDEDTQSSVKVIRDDVKKKIGKLRDDVFSMSPEDMLKAIQGAYPFMKELSGVVIEFINKFSKAKKDKGALDFNDLEHLCLKILSNEECSARDNFKEYFDEVLVDEYQDSNNVQEAIIDLVSRKNSDDPNVFMVGDVKQSIYRFRQAKPELFLEKYNTYSKGMGKNRKIQLYKNFRSRAEVIYGSNYIFKELMSGIVGELEYTDEEALNLGASYLKTDEKDVIVGGEIELHVLDKSQNKDDLEKSSYIGEEDEEDIGAINLEARIVASRIKELISGKDGKSFKVQYEVTENDQVVKKYRNVTYKDIVILLRATKNWSEIFLDEIGAEGIPIYADTGSGYFESIEIRTIMSLLKVIDNPLQDVPLLALLRSPIIGFKAEELSNIRLINRDNYFYENIKIIAGSGSDLDLDLDQSLKQRCKDFVDRLGVWRDRAIYTHIDEFIWYLYMDTSYYGYVGAMPNGVLRQANLRILFQRAKQYEETSFKGLFNFINFINKLRKSSGDMGSAKILGENEDVVRIMSIHKSKGLEFPIVFLCGAGKRFNLMDLNKSILYHDELGFGPEFIDLNKRISYTTLPKESIKKKIKLETLSEEMRILYVAFTRAKEKLIITGAASDVDKWVIKSISAGSLDENVVIPSEVVKGKSYLDWIGMAILKHRDGKALREKVGSEHIHIIDDLSTWKTKIWSKNDLIVDKDLDAVDKYNKKQLLITSNDNTALKEIEYRLGFKYKFKELTNIKSNFSVSDLKKKNYEEEDLNDTKELYSEKIEIKPKFMQQEKGLTSAERGTAMHYVMQKLDFDRVDSIGSIKEQIDELEVKHLISTEEKKCINVSKVFNFFNSNLGKRMLKSYKDGSAVYKELPFYTEISVLDVDKKLSKYDKNEMVRLQGVIDCFFYEGDDIVLLDYKTDYIEEGNEDEAILRYKIQIKYYKEALEKITLKKVKQCFLYLFYLDKEVEVN